MHLELDSNLYYLLNILLELPLRTHFTIFGQFLQVTLIIGHMGEDRILFSDAAV